MNARVDPAALREPTHDDDARLVALCKAAMRAIDVDVDCEGFVRGVEAQYHTQRPPYPELAWAYSRTEDTAYYLRRVLKERGEEAPPEWRRRMRAQIAAVATWERACKAVEKALGLDKICRQYDRATALSRRYVEDVAAMPAATVKGAAYKAMVSARWIAAGYTLESDGGKDLVMSIMHDIQLLGTVGSNNGTIRLGKRATR